MTNDELEIQKQQMELIFKLLKQTKNENIVEKENADKPQKPDEEEDIKNLIESQMRLYGFK